MASLNYLDCDSDKNPLYRIWKRMRQRCRDKTNKVYGGKGITVCPEWENNYLIFRLWALSNGYEEGLSIERKNNDKGYNPDNCRWIIRGDQLRNTSRNIILTAFGETKLQKDWIKDSRCIVSATTFKMRVQKGWNIELALTTPARKIGKGAISYGT